MVKRLDFQHKSSVKISKGKLFGVVFDILNEHSFNFSQEGHPYRN
jgi:hypothetical protein